MDNELYHHGIKGQKWGEQNGPPYPLKSSIKEKIYGHKLKRKKKKLAKQRIKNLKKARKAKEEIKKRQEKFDRNKSIISRDPVKMYKYRDMFSTEEIERANQRFQKEKNLQELSLAFANKGKTYMDTATSWLESGYKMYVTIDKVSKLMDKRASSIKSSRSSKEAQAVIDSLVDTPIEAMDLKSLGQRENAIKALERFEKLAKGKG